MDRISLPASPRTSKGYRGTQVGRHLSGLKPAHRHLSPADFDLAKRVTRSTNAKDFFENNCQFWDSIFSKAGRPTSREVFRQLEDRMARYYPLLIKLFPTPETRPRPSERLIEIYRKGKITEAFRTFKKIYLEIVKQVIDHLESQEAGIPFVEFV